MAHLDRYLDEMACNVERRGGRVYFASDGSEAVRYIADLARDRQARLIVKSKSMTTEEIELNRRLQEEYPELGLEIVETDLGEWIAQLAGDTPSHIIAPILHMNRRQVAAVLSAAAGYSLPPNVQDLMQFARQRLREKFLTADIGISGANFAVAETGTVVLVTNEGNGRLITSLPRIHVAVVGIEKLIPRLEDLSVFLKLLGRSGTGQAMTVYTNLLTGPRQPGELDGAEEFHLIFLDNGRSRLLGTEFEEALHCIRCGACLNVCPVYRQIGGHAYGSTYSGPIGAVITPLLRDDREARELPHASSLCGACSETCPVGIPLHELLLRLRHKQVEEGVPSKAQQLIFGGFGKAMASSAAYRTMTTAARAAEPFRGVGRLPSALGPLAAWTDYRELPPVAKKSFHQLWKEGI